MTGFNPIEFAIASAEQAFDQRHAYADPVGAYFDNVVDTLNGYKIVGNDYHRAIEAYRATVAKLFAVQMAKGMLFDVLSHNGVHEIQCEIDDDTGNPDGGSVYMYLNGQHFGNIFEHPTNPNKWSIYRKDHNPIHGTGLDSLLNTIKEIRRY